MTERELLAHNYRNGGNNYILLGNQKWIAFIKNVIRTKLIPQFGHKFNLIIYWYKNSNREDIDFVCIPYTALAHLLTDEHLSGLNSNRERWNFIIKDNLLCVHANTNYSIDISPYINKLENDKIASQTKEHGVEEGNYKYAIHKQIERNSEFINNYKKLRKLKDPMLKCDICGFSFVEKYGDIGDGFIEAHHKIPLSTLEESTITYQDDLILVCSNCHSMLHRSNPFLTIDQLTSILKH